MATITNLDSLRTLAGLSKSQQAISQASERISTGYQINRSSDNPGLTAVANDLKTQLTSYSQILTNVSQGKTTTSLVDASLTKMVDLLGYMRVAAVAAQTSTLTTSERTAYQSAINAYVTAFDTIGTNTTWNGTSLMSTTATMNVQTGVNSGNTTTLTFSKMTTSELSVDSLSTTSTTTAATAVTSIDAAIKLVNVYQTYIGAMKNVMDSQATVATNAITAYSAGYGAIMNTDYAAETAKLAAAQIQHDGATAMLIQGNGLNRALVDYLLGGPSTYAPRTN